MEDFNSENICEDFEKFFRLWILYAAIGLLILPLRHKPSLPEADMVKMNGDITGQERVRSVYLDTEMMLVIDCRELNASLWEQTGTLRRDRIIMRQ